MATSAAKYLRTDGNPAAAHSAALPVDATRPPLPHPLFVTSVPEPALPLVSLVLASFNSAAHIDLLTASLHALTYPNLELILVDDGSSDGSVDRFVSQYPGVLVDEATDANRGYGPACNRGARMAQGEHVVFLNCDVVLESDAIEQLVRPLDEQPDIGAVMAKLLVRDEPQTLNASAGGSSFLGFGWNERCLMHDAEPARDDVIDVGFACGAAFAVRRELFELVGGFDESFFMYMEDVDLSWRIRMAGYRTVVANAARVHHDYVFFVEDRRFCYYAERNRWAMLLKCYRWWSLLLLAPFLLGVEVVVLGYAWRERWLGAKLRANVSVVRTLRATLTSRRATQRLRRGDRRGPDSEPWTAQLHGGIGSPHLHHPLVRLGNALLAPMWHLLRLVVR